MLFLDDNFEELLANKHVILDNNFLAKLFLDEVFFKYFLEKSNTSVLIIDPFVKFEFLRDIYVPEQRELREIFINEKKIFHPANLQHEIYQKVLENWLIFSRIYSNFCPKTKKPGFVDFCIMGRLLLFKGSVLLITNNKMHFPNFLFDIKSCLTYTQLSNPNSIEYSLLQLNMKKFQRCLEEIEKKIVIDTPENEDIPF